MASDADVSLPLKSVQPESVMCVCGHVHVCACICAYVCACVHMCVHVCICVCMCWHKEKQNPMHWIDHSHHHPCHTPSLLTRLDSLGGFHS